MAITAGLTLACSTARAGGIKDGVFHIAGLSHLHDAWFWHNQ